MPDKPSKRSNSRGSAESAPASAPVLSHWANIAQILGVVIALAALVVAMVQCSGGTTNEPAPQVPGTAQPPAKPGG